MQPHPINSDASSSESPRADESALAVGRISVTLEDGQRVEVAPAVVRRDPNGGWVLHVRATPAVPPAALAGAGANEVHPAGPATVPIVEERLHVTTHPVVGDTVRVSTHVTERQEIVDVPIALETVDVERVAINREIDQPVQMRQEGETLIVPVVEEVLVVQKKLILREEVRLTRRHIRTSERQSVTLRRTEATVERQPASESPNLPT